MVEFFFIFVRKFEYPEYFKIHSNLICIIHNDSAQGLPY